jgi:hypothetical protein
LRISQAFSFTGHNGQLAFPFVDNEVKNLIPLLHFTVQAMQDSEVTYLDNPCWPLLFLLAAGFTLKVIPPFS